MVDQFWQYVADVNTKMDGVVDNLKSSQLTRELDGLIRDTMAELSVYSDDLQNKLAPYTKDAGERFARDFAVLRDRLHADMLGARNKAAQYSEEMRVMMEQNVDDVRNRLNLYTRKLKKRLGKDTEEIRR
nr:PREDICTED: apolipoprotein Eb-like [Lepisosteus oculatus]